jgi:transposase
MAGLQRTRPWELGEAVWGRARPLLPTSKPHPKGGRPRRDDRQMPGAILYALRTGIQWDALPREIGASIANDLFGRGTLEWLLTPRQLARIGGHQPLAADAAEYEVKHT